MLACFVGGIIFSPAFLFAHHSPFPLPCPRASMFGKPGAKRKEAWGLLSNLGDCGRYSSVFLISITLLPSGLLSQYRVLLS